MILNHQLRNDYDHDEADFAAVFGRIPEFSFLSEFLVGGPEEAIYCISKYAQLGTEYCIRSNCRYRSGTDYSLYAILSMCGHNRPSS